MSPRVGFLILLLAVSVLARRSGGGSYGGGHGHIGHTGGHTGGGVHYPPAPGYSGHGSGSGVHSYPPAPGYSGHGSGSSGSGVHSYPPAPGYSGHGSGSSVNNNRPQGTYHKTEVHHHHYSPPQQVHYGSQHYPVYQGAPPVYVYQYRDSGSRFNNLLTGLALYNLGRWSAHDHHHYQSQDYAEQPGELCKLQIVKSNSESEEIRIKCQLMSTFVWDHKLEQDKQKNRIVSSNTSTVTTELKKIENSGDNGTVVTTVTNTTTVVDALQAKGPSIQVTPGMTCYMIHIDRYSTRKNKIDCGVLQSYATSSFRSHSVRNSPVHVMVLLSSILYLFSASFC